jgi:ribA/ribD-fused uncharacterized protein
MNQITEFSGEYRWLSNFYKAPLTMGDYLFPAAEHAYQAAKSLNPNDWRDCAACMLPGAVKRLGRILPIRPDWEEIKLHVMTEVISAKYEQNPHLKEKLIQTKGIELIEGNHWGDTYWGVCKGVGENHLGKILMAYRDGTQEGKDGR